jgi:ferredoxin
MARYEVDVDPMLCTGSRLCTAIAPHAFAFDEAGFHSAVRGGPFTDDDTVREAGQSCPVEAISVVDEETGEHVAP